MLTFYDIRNKIVKFFEETSTSTYIKILYDIKELYKAIFNIKNKWECITEQQKNDFFLNYDLKINKSLKLKCKRFLIHQTLLEDDFFYITKLDEVNESKYKSNTTDPAILNDFAKKIEFSKILLEDPIFDSDIAQYTRKEKEYIKRNEVCFKQFLEKCNRLLNEAIHKKNENYESNLLISDIQEETDKYISKICKEYENYDEDITELTGIIVTKMQDVTQKLISYNSFSDYSISFQKKCDDLIKSIELYKEIIYQYIIIYKYNWNCKNENFVKKFYKKVNVQGILEKVKEIYDNSMIRIKKEVEEKSIWADELINNKVLTNKQTFEVYKLEIYRFYSTSN